jgi:CheY-like chemotaxis protein
LLNIFCNNSDTLKAETILNEVDVKSDFAINGKQGVEKVCLLQPDLILMDIHMSIMDGLGSDKKTSFKLNH